MTRTSGTFVERAGSAAALLSAVEVGLGSLLHAFRIPLSGHTLSLNQSFLLTRALKEAREEPSARVLPAWISSIAALLKSLSPAGKKLTPMLAIAAQGLLYSLGPLLLGTNIFGAVLGAVISSTWAFLQPLFLYVLVFGPSLADLWTELEKRLEKDFSFVLSHLPEKLLLVFCFLLAVKAVLAAALAIVAWRASPGAVARFEARLIEAARKRVRQGTSLRREESPWRGALRDLSHPLYVSSAGLVAVFWIWADSSWVTVVWNVARPLALAFVIFWILRSVDWNARLPALRRFLGERYAESFRVAVEKLREF